MNRTRVIATVAAFGMSAAGVATLAPANNHDKSPISHTASEAVQRLRVGNYGRTQISDQCYVMTKSSAMKSFNRSLATHYTLLSVSLGGKTEEFLLACARRSGIEQHVGKSKCEAEYIPLVDYKGMQKLFSCEPLRG